MSIMKARFEEIRKKYQKAKREESNIDMLSSKSETESFTKDLQFSEEKNEDLLADAEDILIDLCSRPGNSLYIL